MSIKGAIYKFSKLNLGEQIAVLVATGLDARPDNTFTVDQLAEHFKTMREKNLVNKFAAEVDKALDKDENVA